MKDKLEILAQIEKVLEQRKDADPQDSYAASLYRGGASACGEKVREEAQELIEAALGDDAKHTVHEAADLLFHLQILLVSKDLSLAEVCAELERRFGTSGHTEKSQRGKQDK